jgi:hypothetical protein
MDDQVEDFVRNATPVTNADETMTKKENAPISRANRTRYSQEGLALCAHRGWDWRCDPWWVPAETISAQAQDKWWASCLSRPLWAFSGNADILAPSNCRGAGRQSVELGTVLAFIFRDSAVLPSLIMLKRVVKMPLLVVHRDCNSILTIGFTFNRSLTFSSERTYYDYQILGSGCQNVSHIRKKTPRRECGRQTSGGH